MAQFSYISADNAPTSLMPRLPLVLTRGTITREVLGLLDTGAAINVLPFSTGIALGAVWEEQTTAVPLAGNLAGVESRALLLMASHPDITGIRQIRLVFAWARTDQVPIIFGQMNFFLEFDVCFYRSQNIFDVRPKTTAGA